MRQRLEIDLLLGLDTLKQNPGISVFFQVAQEFGRKVELLEGYLQEFIYRAPDALISPGNNYGHMSGGLDLAVQDMSGGWAEAAIQREIGRKYLNELSVGQALLVSNPVGRVKHVIYAPTMRAPKKLEWGNDVPYRATLAALQQIHQYNTANPASPIIRVVTPMMGVGTGEIPAVTALTQQALALHRYSYEEPVDHLFRDGAANDELISNTWPKRF
jgi:O-acetyl-ADP-ribose deacetylase (regulator of RNase III)